MDRSFHLMEVHLKASAQRVFTKALAPLGGIIDGTFASGQTGGNFFSADDLLMKASLSRYIVKTQERTVVTYM